MLGDSISEYFTEKIMKKTVKELSKELPYEFWRENIMDERLAYLDSDEKFALYNEWLLDVKATREKINKIYAHRNDC